MTSQEAVYARFPATRRRIVQLEADIENWRNVTEADAMPMPQEVFWHALTASQALRDELAELRELLTCWEARRNLDKTPIATHVLFLAAALYMAMMVGVILYLIALVR